MKEMYDILNKPNGGSAQVAIVDTFADTRMVLGTLGKANFEITSEGITADSVRFAFLGMQQASSLHLRVWQKTPKFEKDQEVGNCVLESYFLVEHRGTFLVHFSPILNLPAGWFFSRNRTGPRVRQKVRQ